ncbi:uncharacterized protein BX664DRAFT_387660 [Halteromyces radiatus]|uniref:uncharacterized protein n=1 Tax=Halteromyces radiatus TaxID=101107 RepID=UPI002220EB01|nr:uncharacterized protein BX664DRAFT_387660 [Halteromyces radiatus]KAI8085014.1 hypothetical protein BX664DRAFT_387660 [Halteromyces radiatus]
MLESASTDLPVASLPHSLSDIDTSSKLPTTTTITTTTTTKTSSSACINYGTTAGITAPPKRGHKYHVASACVNCKKAHLACDASRPCKRCVSLGKTDSCLDIKHKKRGRPKLQDKKAVMTTKEKYEIMHGTIQTPTFASSISTNGNNVNNNQQVQPMDKAIPPKQISFRHQPIEAFQQSTNNNNKGGQLTTEAIQLVPIELTPSMEQPELTIDTSSSSLSSSPSSSTLSTSTSSSSLLIPPMKMTLILSMEICCARIPDDIIKTWGYYPQELAHRSMYDFVAVEDTDRLSRLHRQLLDKVVQVASEKNPSQQHQTPPPTERTTSDLFHQKQLDELATIANGSPTINDTLHIKTRSGPKELYDICVFMGGGFGGDLDDPSTLSKLYIVMTCQKHSTLEKQQQQQRQQSGQHQWPIRISQQSQRVPVINRAIAPLLSPANKSTSSRLTTNRYAFHGNRPIQPAPHDLRHVSLPAHFANNSKLNTISFRGYQETPKINIAPSTLRLDDNQQSSSKPSSTSSSKSSNSSTSTSYTYFRPIASASVQKPSTNDQPFATIAYRYVPHSSPGPQPSPTVTHPTTQYFLQTSSSTLNAAASAVQDHSRSSSHQPTGSSSEVTPSKKQGISIRSLLC